MNPPVNALKIGQVHSLLRQDLRSSPELVNSDPYGAGWLCEISTESPTDYEALLDAAAYGALTNQ